MPRRKKLKLPPLVTKTSVVMILSLAVGAGIYFAIAHYVVHADYFKIKVVQKDQDLSFIRNKDLAGLKGKSIFKVDLISLQRKLSYKYPQASQLKIIKQLPDQISIEAKKREPFVQALIKNRMLTLDQRAVVLSTSGKRDKKLPFIDGIAPVAAYSLGLPLRGRNVHTALRIIKAFNDDSSLASYGIAKLNIESLSKIDIELSNGLTVIVDAQEIERKISKLSVVLSKGKINPKEVSYLDLRFKDPIIGKK